MRFHTLKTVDIAQARGGTAMAVVYALTLFLSAFLLFSVEPLVAKMLLPAVGGAPMVWTTCVVFFQLLLLVGYVYAHSLARWLTFRHQFIVHILVLVSPLATLPFSTRVLAPASTAGSPVWWLLHTLFDRIGLAFLALAATAVVLQQWFSKTRHLVARDPYFLYAASNLGSLLALILYPAVVERTFHLARQSQLWAIGYGLLVIAACLCAVVAARGASRETDEKELSAPPGPAFAPSDPARLHPQRAKWLVLSFLPSSLMLGVTNYLTTDIAAVPLIWIGPLSLYLLTLVVAFGSFTRRVRTVASRAVRLLFVPVVLFMVAQAGIALWLVVSLHLMAFTAAALMCHAELAESRPAQPLLTEFYVWIALGGTLGGLFNSVITPVLFSDVVEYPLVLVLVCLYRSDSFVQEQTRTRVLDLAIPVAIGALTAALLVGVHRFGVDVRLLVAALGLPALVAFSQSRRPTRFGLSLAAMLLVGHWVGDAYGQTLHRERTFFGVYRIAVDESHQYYSLFHGTTLHGMQAIDPARQNEPLTYYHRTGPFGQAFHGLPNVAHSQEIAVVGLGVGSLAAYAMPGQRWTFYEIDPAVERLARTTEYFTYLRDCGDRCRVVLGDARASLAAAAPHSYALIVLDAFSSDAIPMHLLTREAMSLYRSRLAPNGLLAFHISNRHLTLGPVLARIAISHGMMAVERQDEASVDAYSSGKRSSDWVLVASTRDDVGSLATDPRWRSPVVSRSTPLWTDDASSILGVLRFR